MKITGSIFMTALVLLSTSIFLFPVYAQNEDIGGFDIDKVYEDVAAEDDGASLFGQGADSPMRQPENYALVLLRVIGYLVLVTAVIFVAAWGLRRFGAAGVSRVGAGNNMDIIETVYIGQNRGATLVRVGDAVYLLGHTAENIVLLEKIDGERAVDMIASSSRGGAVVSFKDAFNNFLGKMKK